MTIDDLLQTLILGAPNLAVAIWVIYRQQKQIDTLQSQISRYLDDCLDEEEQEQ